MTAAELPAGGVVEAGDVVAGAPAGAATGAGEHPASASAKATAEPVMSERSEQVTGPA